VEVTPNIVSEARETLHHALLLKPDSAEALTTLGGVQMSYDWDWQGAERSLGRAIELAPNSSASWLRYGALLLRIRRLDAAQHSFEKAIELDPLSPIANTNLAMVFFCRRDFPAADAQIRKALEINNDFGMAHWLLSRSLWLQGRKAESAAEIVSSLELDGNAELAARFRDKVKDGSPEDGIGLLLDEWRNDPEGTNPHNMAYMSTYVGDHERAIYWLQRSFKEHHPWTTWIAAAPEFDTLRDDTRFKDLIKDIGFAEQ
ncbi:MAG: tetratricopeptide repeat protein, partial [Candidatus Binatia bacterium]